jgi:hypothetical protein
MTAQEYDALAERENVLWRELLALEKAVKAKNAEWEAAADAVADARLRDFLQVRLADRLTAERRGQEVAP